MDKNTLFELYCKERNYQQRVFGAYEKDPNLNLASFLTFIEEYLNKCKKSYVDKWDEELPKWLRTCNEDNSYPVNTYEQLIKLFVLAGAALESYCNVDVDEWREEGIINSKWQRDI